MNEIEKKAIYLEHINKFFDIQWRIGSKCNLNCSYCSATKNKHDFTNEDLIELIPNLNLLFRKAYEVSKKPICFHPSGCEPTLWDLHKWMALFDEKYVQQVNIISNGTASVEYYNSLREILEAKGIKLRLSFSWHEQPDVDAFVEKAKACKCNMVKVVICDVEKYKKEYERLAELSYEFPIQACVVRIDSGKADVTEEREEVYKKFKPAVSVPRVLVKFNDGETRMMHIHEYSSLGYDCDFRGYKCYAGTNSLMLTTMGKIRRGGACTGKNIGQIYDIEHFEMPTKPFICVREGPCNLCGQPKISLD